MDKVQTSLLRCGERGVTVELQGLSTEHSWNPNRSADFSSMLPLPKPRVPVNSPHLLVVRKIRFLRSHWRMERRSLKWTEGGDDHVKFVLAGLAPDCQHHFEYRAEEGQIGAIERGKEGRGKDWSSPIRHGALNK